MVGFSLRDIMKNKIRVSLILDMRDKKNVLIWGSYRYNSGWDGEEGYDNFDRIVKRY